MMLNPQRLAHDRPILRSSAIVGPLQVGLGVEQPHPAVDEPPADLQEHEERNLARLVGALRLALFDFERRHDLLLARRADGLLGLLHAHGSGTDVG